LVLTGQTAHRRNFLLLHTCRRRGFWLYLRCLIRNAMERKRQAHPQAGEENHRAPEPVGKA